MLGEILVSPLHFYVKHFHLLQIFLGYLTTHITYSFLRIYHIRTAVSSEKVPFQPGINVTSHKRSATDGFSLLQDIFWVIDNPGQRPTDSRIVTLSVFLFINYQCEM